MNSARTMPREAVCSRWSLRPDVGLLPAFALLGVLACVAARGGTYDAVIAHGRVIDPESRLDGIRTVGIRVGQVVAVSTVPLVGRKTIEARGWIVAPDFIDLHEHGQKLPNYQFQARDGVTTSRELAFGTDEVAQWYAARQGRSVVNYGVSADHIPMQIHVMTGEEIPSLDAAHSPVVEIANHREVTLTELGRLREAIERGLRQCTLAEGRGVNHSPDASHWESLQIFRSATKFHAPLQFYLRYSSLIEAETGMAALEEAIAVAAVT